MSQNPQKLVQVHLLVVNGGQQVVLFCLVLNARKTIMCLENGDTVKRGYKRKGRRQMTCNVLLRSQLSYQLKHDSWTVRTQKRECLGNKRHAIWICKNIHTQMCICVYYVYIYIHIST